MQDLVLPKRYQSAFLILTDLLIISVLGGMEARYYQAFILQMSKLRHGNDSAIPGLGSLGSDPRTAIYQLDLGTLPYPSFNLGFFICHDNTTYLVELIHVKTLLEQGLVLRSMYV